MSSADSVSCLPLEINFLPDDVRRKAEVELNETAEKKVQGLRHLKEMAKDDKVLRDWDFHSDFLLQFLRHSKFNVNKAFVKLGNFVRFRLKYGSMFESVEFDEFVKKPSNKFYTVLPKRCHDGCAVILIEMGKWDPEHLPFEDFKRINMLVQLQALRNPVTQINGFKMIYDFTDASLKLLTHISPKNFYTLGYAASNCFPIRYTEIHTIAESVVLKTAWAIVKRVLTEKIRNRVLFHSSREELLSHFPPSVLPEEYGGLLTDYYMEDWMRKANQQQKACTMSGQCNYF